MRKKHLFGLFIFCILAGYFLGMFFPLKNMLPVVEKKSNTISTYEFHSLFVNWVLVVTTLLTVIVALLKEEIVKCFRHPKLSIHRKEKNALKEKLDDVEQDRKIADEFYYTIGIENTGNVEARNIDLIITSLRYANNVTEIEIPLRNKHIELSDCDLGKILAPSMYSEATIFSLIRESSSQNMTNANQSNANKTSYSLKIGNNVIGTEYYSGELKLTIQVYCDGGYKDSREIKIKWDGVWEDRLVDIIKNHISVEEADNGK